MTSQANTIGAVLVLAARCEKRMIVRASGSAASGDFEIQCNGTAGVVHDHVFTFRVDNTEQRPMRNLL